MLAHVDMRAVRLGGRPRRQSKSYYSVLLVLGIFVLVAGGCSAAPRMPLLGANPADPNATVSATKYRSTVGPYTRARPVTPAPWRDQNQRVTPEPKS